jgi:acetoin utilization deacetylase AcuC-like enzyme
MPKSAALLLDDPSFDEHRPVGHHPERPERLRAARAAVERAHLQWEKVAAREATADELELVHDARFVEALESLRGKSGYLDPDTYVSPKSIEAAKRAAGGLVVLVDRMIETDMPGVALLRPPGHHARPSRAMGFCLLNNVAVAAAHARKKGIERVAIVDWDVHHGNGTQETFYSDPSVLYVSTHQFPFYPGTGAVGETGEGEGKGFTINVPLRAGEGDGEYRAAFDRIVMPALEQFAPDLVLVSAGFDAADRDPLAEMNVSPDGFAYMAHAIGEQARKSAKGRVALVLEGGYDLVGLEEGLVRAIASGISGEAAHIEKKDSADVAEAAKVAGRAWKGID